jgi:hypothetical protein
VELAFYVQSTVQFAVAESRTLHHRIAHFPQMECTTEK